MLVKDQNGFTVVELLIVVIIIGALIAIAVPNYTGIIERAEKVACKANIRSIELVRTYSFVNAGTYGSSMADLDQVFSEIGFIGDSSKEDLVCPTGGEYVFVTGTSEVTCTLVNHNN